METLIYNSPALIESAGDVRHVRIATEQPDRANDVVVVRGGRFDAYRQNPTVLYEHIGSRDEVDGMISYPVGRCKRLWIERGADGDELHGHDELDDDESNPVARLVSRMVSKGIINGVSVAFLPLAEPEVVVATDEMLRSGRAYPFVRAGESRPTLHVYHDWEKLEHSLVILPVNPHSVVLKSARSSRMTASHTASPLTQSRATLDALIDELLDAVKETSTRTARREIETMRAKGIDGRFRQERFTEVAATELIAAAIEVKCQRSEVRG